MSDSKSGWLSGKKIDPEPIARGIGAADLVDQAFQAFNAGRLERAARLLVERMLEPGSRVGMSLSGALTPAGLGRSALVPFDAPPSARPPRLSQRTVPRLRGRWHRSPSL